MLCYSRSPAISGNLTNFEEQEVSPTAAEDVLGIEAESSQVTPEPAKSGPLELEFEEVIRLHEQWKEDNQSLWDSISETI